MEVGEEEQADDDWGEWEGDWGDGWEEKDSATQDQEAKPEGKSIYKPRRLAGRKSFRRY